jgi:hypothetical protein
MEIFEPNIAGPEADKRVPLTKRFLATDAVDPSRANATEDRLPPTQLSLAELIVFPTVTDRAITASEFMLHESAIETLLPN